LGLLGRELPQVDEVRTVALDEGAALGEPGRELGTHGRVEVGPRSVQLTTACRGRHVVLRVHGGRAQSGPPRRAEPGAREASSCGSWRRIHGENAKGAASTARESAVGSVQVVAATSEGSGSSPPSSSNLATNTGQI